MTLETTLIPAILLIALVLILLRFAPIVIAVAIIIVVAVFTLDAVQGGTAYLQLVDRSFVAVQGLFDAILALAGGGR